MSYKPSTAVIHTYSTKEYSLDNFECNVMLATLSDKRTTLASLVLSFNVAGEMI